MPTTANLLATTINDSQPGTTTTSSTQDSTVASKLKSVVNSGGST